MGVYNPHAPYVIGQEWIPIRDESLSLTPAVNAVEMGHQFTATAARTLQDARFYISDLPPATAAGQVFLATIYSQGQEDLSGPIRRVVIPCNSGAISGTGSISLIDATTVTQAMADPSDQSCVEFNFQASTGTPILDMYFAVNSYLPLLENKRILGVNLLYSLLNYKNVPYAVGGPYVLIGANSGNEIPFGGYDADIDSWGNDASFKPTSTNVNQTGKLGRIQFGEIDHFWSTADPLSTTERLPWTLANLQRFEVSAANRHAVRIRHPHIVSTASVYALRLNYAALEIIFCEENRLYYGGRIFGYDAITPQSGVNSYQPYTPGANLIPIRDKSLAANPSLAAGAYSVTLASASVGDLANQALLVQAVKSTSYPVLNAVRELESLSGMNGVQVNLPFPTTDAIVGKTFTAETTHILPQLSLHTSGGPLTEVHVYGRQAVAQVYGTITATQEILDSAAGGAANFTQARFYARRFGDTTVPLTLDSPSIPGPSASITPTEFDALDEVLDGWKQVTLTLSAAASMGTGTAPQWRWSAAGETVNNRWEVLGATAPALSGVPGNLLNLVPSPHQLSVATYGAPVSGAQINLGWIPQYAPSVTATVDDNTSDAFLIFSQDMPTVSGFSVAIAAQAVSGIGQLCDTDPCCIPNQILYHSLTWAATSSSVPASGFGYYELQRMDAVDTDWRTIMKASSPTGAAFMDYEARVGVLTSYRIRAVNELEFPGPWSATVTSTLTGPGVSGSGDCFTTGGHVLIFTSNERQDGSINLAYSEAWEGSGTRVEEGFAFPEAGFNQLQAMYGADFFTAFRPLERGGAQFQRTLLVQAAAIASPPTLPGFWSLRDMAWDTVSYICVRDEDGNRWFATVLVPSGRVLLNRTQYFAQVNVIETTDIPSPVDPWS